MQTWISRIKGHLKQRSKGAHSKATVTEYLGDWLTDVVAPHNSRRTRISYAIAVNRQIVPIIGGIQLLRLQPADVQKMESQLQDSGLSPNAVHHVHHVLAKALRYAKRQRLVHHNACEAVESPSPGRKETK